MPIELPRGISAFCKPNVDTSPIAFFPFSDLVFILFGCVACGQVQVRGAR